MRRKLFMLSLVATIVAVSCDSDKKNVPAPDDGENKPTTYCDVLLPDEGFGRDEMVWLLELVEEQEGEIDDALFVEKLHTTFFDCADGYYVSGEPKQWMWAALVDGGGDMLGAIYFDDDGTYVSREVFLSTFTGDEVGERMLRDGYAGWYSRNDWHYEAESNTLITSFEGMSFVPRCYIAMRMRLFCEVILAVSHLLLTMMMAHISLLTMSSS